MAQRHEWDDDRHETRVSWALPMVMATARAATSMTTARTSIRSAMATII